MKALAFILGLLLAGPAWAQGTIQIIPPAQGYTTMLGTNMRFPGGTGHLGSGSTVDIFDFSGVWSHAIEICTHEPGSQVFIRRGTRLLPDRTIRLVSDATTNNAIVQADSNQATGDRMTIVATSSGVFRKGSSQHLPGSAWVVSREASSAIRTGAPSVHRGGTAACRTYPIRTRGLIVHATGAASLDIRVLAP